MKNRRIIFKQKNIQGISIIYPPCIFISINQDLKLKLILTIFVANWTVMHTKNNSYMQHSMVISMQPLLHDVKFEVACD